MSELRKGEGISEHEGDGDNSLVFDHRKKLRYFVFIAGGLIYFASVLATVLREGFKEQYELKMQEIEDQGLWTLENTEIIKEYYVEDEAKDAIAYAFRKN